MSEVSKASLNRNGKTALPPRRLPQWSPPSLLTGIGVADSIRLRRT
jgi:hypothetical protein